MLIKAVLYEEIAKLEELARNCVLDTPINSTDYLIYFTQLNERTALKHKIADYPVADVVPVVHGKWEEKPFLMGITNECSICKDFFGMPHGKFNYCPNCGAKMDLED